ncbi:helix-turn-helix transcriptional regulator [Yersinia enterocolitica]|uniref:helix-turn-helix transcriptional regulator n=1 Tax=Yersinia enterocolitica TaxID=630 RepID=UPI002AC71F15|nr:AlpA family phage regulatory protein [Yersinia enterocolitica]HEN3663298.1 AlpA family phage regulatory protein [Yersinia enterocolitica]
MTKHQVPQQQFPLSGNARIKSVAAFLAISEATVWRKVKQPGFPQPTKLSERVTVFDAAEIRQWMAQLVAERLGADHA